MVNKVLKNLFVIAIYMLAGFFFTRVFDFNVGKLIAFFVGLVFFNFGWKLQMEYE